MPRRLVSSGTVMTKGDRVFFTNKFKEMGLEFSEINLRIAKLRNHLKETIRKEKEKGKSEEEINETFTKEFEKLRMEIEMEVGE